MSFLGWLNTQPDATKGFFWQAAQWAKDYPSIAKQYKRHPEVLRIMMVGSLEGWDPEQIEDQLAQTPYYQKTTESQRDMDVLAVMKPAEYQKVAYAGIANMNKIATRLGLNMRTGNAAVDKNNLLRDIAAIVNNKLSDQQTADYLITKYTSKTPAGATAEIRNSMNEVRAIARDYAQPISDMSAYWYAISIQTKSDTLDGIKGKMSKAARGMFNNPDITRAIDAGQTIREWADPYVQIAATTLEIGADTIDLSQGKWQKFLKVLKADPKSGYGVNFRTMTLSEWQATLRTDKQYGFDTTENARQSAVDMTTAIKEKFGAAG